MSTGKIHNYRFLPGTMAETTTSSQVKNSYPTVQVSNFQMNTQLNPVTSQNTMTSNEKGNIIYDANGEPLNHPFAIANSVATRNIAHQYRRSDSWKFTVMAKFSTATAPRQPLCSPCDCQ